MAEKILRPYQQDAIDAINLGLINGINKQILVLPTGGGKTFTAISAIEQFNKKLWIANTEELIEQSGIAALQEMFPNSNIYDIADKYGGLTPYVRYIQQNPMFAELPENEVIKKVSIIKADLFGLSGDIVLASAQTMYRRLDRIDPNYFDVVVVDECHGFGGKSHSLPLKHFQPQLLLGLTATPHRADGMLLGDLFDSIIYQYNIGDAIRDGYLVELDAIQIKTQLSLDGVRTTAGEFNQKDLTETVDTPERNKYIVQKYKEYADGLQNLVFCIDVKHAQNLCQEFKDAGYKAEFIVGDVELTPDRRDVIERFKSGITTILCNVMVLTAGFDYPGIRVVTLACPTKSLTKFIQQLGRSTRTLPGVINGLNTPAERISAIKASAKSKAIILDVVDTTTRHRLINTWELDKTKPIEERTFTTSEKKQLLIDVREKRKFEALTKKDTRIDLLQLPKVKQSTSIKMTEPATEKQLAWIGRLGYDVVNINYTKAMASEIISAQSASDKQIWFLSKAGYDTSNGVTVAEAAAAFDALKKKEAEKFAEQAIKEATKNTNPPLTDLF